MKQSACGRAVRDFCKETTLHGFKYLASKNYYDRVGWVVSCVASACCAGVLCSVLWARFLQVPALLTLRDLRLQLAHIGPPLVAVCPSAEAVAEYFENNLTITTNISGRLPIVLRHVLRRKKTPQQQLTLLQDLLLRNNLTLPQALLRVTPPCHQIVQNCRWQNNMMSCEDLFHKELTEWGVCCISRPNNTNLDGMGSSRLEVTRRLTLAVQCSKHSASNGCEFFTKYEGEEWVEPMPLTPGYSYLAHITFTSVVDSNSEKLTDGTCDPTEGYSRNGCLLKCKERNCGCSELLRNEDPNYKTTLPPCAGTQFDCLRAFHIGNNTCNCLPSCRKVFTYIALESSPMNAISYTNDEIYANINASASSVLHIAVRLSESRLFVVNPTETWITLLSSLGGVFNMFLGVGLFSALEVLFLIFVRLPIAVRKSSNMANSSDM